MANVNEVRLLGRLTKDPELRYTPQGTAVCDISIAINRKWTDQSQQPQEEVTFVDVTLWAKTAENTAQYMKKGREIYVAGRLQLDRWQDAQTGQNRQRLKVVGSNVQFLGGNPNAQQGAPQPQGQPQTQPNPGVQQPDDVPF